MQVPPTLDRIMPTIGCLSKFHERPSVENAELYPPGGGEEEVNSLIRAITSNKFKLMITTNKTVCLNVFYSWNVVEPGGFLSLSILNSNRLSSVEPHTVLYLSASANNMNAVELAAHMTEQNYYPGYLHTTTAVENQNVWLLVKVRNN